jgi:capsular polysaccharide biosynthesis protein
VIPSLLAQTTVPHKALPDLLKAAFPPTRASAAERVYVSRAETFRRRLSNEADLMSLLGTYGFETFVTGRMSFEAQRNLFYGAKAIVAVHGAAMGNLLFSPPGCDVLEIAPEGWRPTFFNVLCGFCGHRHEFAPAHIEAPDAEGHPMNGTWQADLDAIEAALRQRFARR